MMEEQGRDVVIEALYKWAPRVCWVRLPAVADDNVEPSWSGVLPDAGDVGRLDVQSPGVMSGYLVHNAAMWCGMVGRDKRTLCWAPTLEELLPKLGAAVLAFVDRAERAWRGALGGPTLATAHPGTLEQPDTMVPAWLAEELLRALLRMRAALRPVAAYAACPPPEGSDMITVLIHRDDVRAAWEAENQPIAPDTLAMLRPSGEASWRLERVIADRFGNAWKYGETAVDVAIRLLDDAARGEGHATTPPALWNLLRALMVAVCDEGFEVDADEFVDLAGALNEWGDAMFPPLFVDTCEKQVRAAMRQAKLDELAWHAFPDIEVKPGTARFRRPFRSNATPGAPRYERHWLLYVVNDEAASPADRVVARHHGLAPGVQDIDAAIEQVIADRATFHRGLPPGPPVAEVAAAADKDDRGDS